MATPKNRPSEGTEQELPLYRVQRTLVYWVHAESEQDAMRRAHEESEPALGDDTWDATKWGEGTLTIELGGE